VKITKMESNTAEYGLIIAIALIFGAAGAYVADYTMEDEITAEDYEALQTELQELQNSYDTLQTELTQTEEELETVSNERDAANKELDNYVKTFTADHTTTYQVNRSEDDQNINDSFKLKVNEPTNNVELQLDYSLKSTDSIDDAGTVESLKVYDGKFEVGEYAEDSWNKEDAPGTYTVELEATEIDEFDGEYTVEIEQLFDLQNDGEGSEILDVEFSVSGTSNYFIYKE